MAGVAAALTAFFLYVAGAITEPPKAILFSGLEPRDAAAVTAKLDAMNVPYEAKGDGGTILVPADQVTKLRMELATDNPARRRRRLRDLRQVRHVRRHRLRAEHQPAARAGRRARPHDQDH